MSIQGPPPLPPLYTLALRRFPWHCVCNGLESYICNVRACRLLDVILFTRSLSHTMGYRRQFALYGYYLFCAQLLRLTSPPLAAMTAQETALGGAFRAAHQRLVANAEEVAVSQVIRARALQDVLPAALMLRVSASWSRGCSWVPVLDQTHPI